MRQPQVTHRSRLLIHRILRFISRAADFVQTLKPKPRKVVYSSPWKIGFETRTYAWRHNRKPMCYQESMRGWIRTDRRLAVILLYSWPCAIQSISDIEQGNSSRGQLATTFYRKPHDSAYARRKSSIIQSTLKGNFSRESRHYPVPLSLLQEENVRIWTEQDTRLFRAHLETFSSQQL